MTNITVLMALCATYTATTCRPKSNKVRVSRWSDLPGYLELYGTASFAWDVQAEHCDYDQLSLVSRYPVYANVALTCLDSAEGSEVDKTVLVVETKEDQAHDLATSVWNVSLDLAGKTSFSHPLVESQGVIRQLHVSAKCAPETQAEVIASVTSYNSTDRQNRTPLYLTSDGCEAAAIEAPPEPSPQATPVPQAVVIVDKCVSRGTLSSVIHTNSALCKSVFSNIYARIFFPWACRSLVSLLSDIPQSCLRELRKAQEAQHGQCAYNISVTGSPEATLALDNGCENETMRDVCDYLYSMCDVSIDHEPIGSSVTESLGMKEADTEWPRVRTYNVYRSIRKAPDMVLEYNGTMRAQSVSPGFPNASAVNIMP